jgi:16S rRNA (guanine966-N2)-methyltransferase
VSRIIAGALASRRIATPASPQTRATTDLVREAVFSQLASWLGRAGSDPAVQLAGVGFLDLYAGSGAVGLEAFSRGASVTWVDKHQGAARVIRHNLAQLGAAGRVVVADVAAFLSRGAQPCQVVWLDPPYAMASEQVEAVIRLADQRGWVAPQGRVVVERSARSCAIEFPLGFHSMEQRRYGETIVWFAERGWA